LIRNRLGDDSIVDVDGGERVWIDDLPSAPLDLLRSWTPKTLADSTTLSQAFYNRGDRDSYGTWTVGARSAIVDKFSVRG
jgi:hypothetical protein